MVQSCTYHCEGVYLYPGHGTACCEFPHYLTRGFNCVTLVAVYIISGATADTFVMSLAQIFTYKTKGMIVDFSKTRN